MLTPQFRDLTEYSALSCNEHLHIIREINTEFTFAIAAPGQGGNYLINRFGFKALACMNNWWPSHAGQNRKLTFYWLKKDAPNLSVVPKRERWCYYDHEYRYRRLQSQLAASGCGFKLAELPISKKEHWRYFSLLRLPIIVGPRKQKFLMSMNYRHIDTGKLASYWLNGWNPTIYTHEKEYKYFDITKELWETRGGDWLYYEADQHKI